MGQLEPEGPDAGSLGTGGGVGDIGTEALGEARRAAVGAGDRLRTELSARSSDAGDRLVQVAGDLRVVADELAERGSAQPAKLAAEAAQQSGRLGGYLRESDAERLLADAEDLMRRQPAAAAAAAALAGFVAARFIKASAHRRYVERTGRPADHVSNAPTIETGGLDPTDSAPAAHAGAAQAAEPR